MTTPSQDPVRGWWAPCAPRAKAVLLGWLAFAFLLQTWLVYSDAPGAVQLDGAALQGRRIWHEHNCQSCHQLYGFGGFLGPDLTNATARLTGERLESILTVGAGVMPAFHLVPGEVAAVGAFLEAMARTGTGQALAASAPGRRRDVPVDAFVAEVDALLTATGTADARAGFHAVRSGACLSCHAPLRATVTGAPDFSRALAARGEAAVAALLVSGSPRGMPPAGLDAAARRSLVRFLGWLGEHRAELVARLGFDETPPSLAWSDLPWWEYR